MFEAMTVRTSKKMKGFEEVVAYHLHCTIQRDLNELMGDSSTSISSMNVSGCTSLSSTSSFDSISSTLVERKVCEVQFKHVFRHYVLPPSLNHIQLGEFVIVQSLIDKSQEDLGVITKIYGEGEFEAWKTFEGPREDADENKVGRILRIASIAERLALPKKFQREGPLLGACLSFVGSTATPMNIYGVEYQYDGKVLFVYYVSDQRVDYRPLVGLLYKMHFKRVRIQMKKTNQCRQFVPVPSAREALVTGQHYLPI